MNMMENILYLDDYINLYNAKKDLLIKSIPYKGTLKYGHIIDHIKFIKKYSKIIKDNKLNKNFFGSNILVIINDSYTKEDKRIIKESLEVLNYKKITFKNEIDYFKLKKNDILIRGNYSYLGITYLGGMGKIKVLNLDYDNFTKEFISDVLKKFKNKKVYIYGKNYLEIIDLLEELNINYYYYADSENLIIAKTILK